MTKSSDSNLGVKSVAPKKYLNTQRLSVQIAFDYEIVVV